MKQQERIGQLVRTYLKKKVIKGLILTHLFQPRMAREPSQKESLSIGDLSVIHWRKSMPGETIGGRPIKLYIKHTGFANL